MDVLDQQGAELVPRMEHRGRRQEGWQEFEGKVKREAVLRAGKIGGRWREEGRKEVKKRSKAKTKN